MQLDSPTPVPGVLRRTHSLLLALALVSITSISWITEQGAFYTTSFFPWGIQVIGMNLGFKTGREMKNLGLAGIAQAVIQAPVNAANSAYSGDALPLLRIDMKFKNYAAIRTLRNRAIKRGILTSAERRFFPIVIQLGDHAVEAKARLTGGQTDHIQHLNKWSIRISTKKGHHVLGMRRFSLRHPKTRGFHAEPLVGEVLRAQGILVPRYRFVRVELNGEALGIMAAEESFVKEMVESQERKEAPIVYHDFTLKRENGYTASPSAFHLSNRSMPIKSQMFEMGSKIPPSFDAVFGRLRSWEAGTSSATEVFDKELLGRFIATCEYFGIKHGLHFYNQRFYLNPLTGWMEPVAYDLNPHQTVWEKNQNRLALSIEDQRHEYGVQSLYEPALWKAYVSSLEELIFQMEEGKLGAQIRDSQERFLKNLWWEFPFLQPIDLDWIHARAKQIKKKVKGMKSPPPLVNETVKPIAFENVPEGDMIRIVESYIIGDKGFEFQALTLFTSEILAIDLEMISETTKKIPLPCNLKFPITIPAAILGEPVTPRHFEACPLPGDAGTVRARITTRLVGSARAYTQLARPGFLARAKPVFPTAVPSQEIMSAYPFIRIEPKTKTAYISTGEWEINSLVRFPDGVSLVVEKGVTIRFAPQAGFVLRGGALKLNGSRGEEIRLIPQVAEEGWSGVAAINAGTVVLEHVYVSSTKGFAEDLWSLTGGVALHRAKVNMSHVVLENAKGEDALNIIRSKFEIDHLTVRGTVSDAFDSDFSQGSVSNSLFIDIGSAGGGDGIDGSGSQIQIHNTKFKNVSDKAISAGEASVFHLTDLDATAAGVGVASKDGSRVTIKGGKITNPSFAGLMAYVKKPVYGGASIEAENLEVQAERTALSQDGNAIRLNEQAVTNTPVDVAKLYDTVMQPGMRK